MIEDRDPLRVRDDPRADAALRTDLSRAAEHPALDFDVAAELARLQAAIGAGGTGTGLTGGEVARNAPVAGTSAGATGSLATIGVGAAVAIALVAGFMWLAHGRDRPAGDALPRAKAPKAAPKTPKAMPPRAREAAHEEVEREPASASEVPEATQEPGRARAAREDASRQVTPGGEAPARIDPRIELEHMARLRRTLERDPAEALAMARDGQARFQPGLFAEEREATAVLALDRLGRRDEARASGMRFLRRFPESAFAERIRKIVDKGRPVGRAP